jgi:hypothetical protein
LNNNTQHICKVAQVYILSDGNIVASAFSASLGGVVAITKSVQATAINAPALRNITTITSSFNLNVNFRAPGTLTPGGICIVFAYNPLNDQGMTASISIAPGATANITIPALEDYTRYIINLQCYTSNYAESLISRYSAFTTPATPYGPPRIDDFNLILRGSTVILPVTAPSGQDIGSGTIRNYIIQISDVSSSSYQNCSAINGVPPDTCTLTGLRANHEYKYRICTVSSPGLTGKLSDPTAVANSGDQPPNPPHFAANPYFTGSNFVLIFIEPSSNTAAVNSYQARVYADTNPSNVAVGSSTSPNIPIKVDDLIPNTIYNIVLYCTANTGLVSDYNNITMQFTTASAALAAPVIDSIVPGPARAMMYFHASNPSTTQYLLFASAVTGTLSYSVVSSSPATIDNLQGNTNYTFYIAI